MKTHGYAQAKRNHGSDIPPLSTLNGWVARLAQNEDVDVAGRPTLLSAPEEEKVVQFVRRLRGQGVVVDRQTLVLVAEEVLSTTRPGDAPPTLTHNWVRSFRRRHGLSRLLSASSDRLPDTPALVAADDQWRAEFEHFCRSEAIPPSMQVCAFPHSDYNVPHPSGGIRRNTLPILPQDQGVILPARWGTKGLCCTQC